MNEKDFLDAIAKAEKEHANAQLKLAKAKKVWTDAETLVIETKIRLQNLKEGLRVFKISDPNTPIEAREREIERFRVDNPELVEWARQRDEDKAKE